nr:hypothetical protein [Tanacetum cinerariifolium]
MKRDFLSQKGCGCGGGRGVKEKDKVVAAKDIVSPSVIDKPVGSISDGTNSKSSYVNFTGELSRKALNLCTLLTPRGNKVDVVVPVESIRTISKRFANTAYVSFWESEWLTPLLLTMLGTLENKLPC